MLRHARGDQLRSERGRPRPVGGGRGGSQQPAEACLAGADHPGLGRAAAARRRSCAGPGCRKPGVWRWQRRFMEAGVDGLLRDKTGKPGRPPLATAVVERVVELTLRRAARARPRTGPAGRWQRPSASAFGTVQRIWRAHGLQPHRVRTFKLIHRPGVRRQAARHRRALRRPAGARRRAVGRREIADPGARPDPAGPADEEGPGRDDDPSMHGPRSARAFCSDPAEKSVAAIYPALSAA